MEREIKIGRKLSVFTYFFILLCVVGITVLVAKELNVGYGLEEILYQKDVASSVEQENKYYIKKIKDEYGIVVTFGEKDRIFATSVNANVQDDVNIANNNIKKIYSALQKYPKDVFNIFNGDYNLYIILVSNFNDNNIALASKNSLNQYRIYVSNTPQFERAFHHEFFHVLEYYMSAKSKNLYYSWNLYNPYGFVYDDNTSTLTDEGVYSEYLTDDTNERAYFLSKYSKVSSKEDRAEIFAEIMTLNKNESYLKRESHIRKKIDYLINGINENITISDFYFSSFLE